VYLLQDFPVSVRGDEGNFGLLRDRGNREREGGKRPTDYPDDLVLADQPFGALLGALGIGLVEPDDLGGSAEQHVVALLQRQHAALGEIFRLIDDLAGLRPDHADLDRLGGFGPSDVGHGEARGGEAGRAQHQVAPADLQPFRFDCLVRHGTPQNCRSLGSAPAAVET